jgi:N-carbamoyl-L-amino-acid hydrolase
MTVQSQTINHKEIRVNQERIEKRIFELAEFGKDATGKGYRVTYTKGDIEGRNWFIEQMKKRDLKSLLMLLEISLEKKRKKPIFKTNRFRFTLIWYPMVVYGGCVGSVAALEAMEILKENIITNHPLEVIILPMKRQHYR